MHLDIAKVEIIDQVEGRDTPYTETMVLSLLQQQVTAMEHGEQFTGRPQTKVYYDQNHILKTHTALNFSAPISSRWILQQLEKERELRVYHPKKTWVLLHEKNGKVIIANIMPRLHPLHQVMEKPVDELDPEQALKVFAQLFNMYFELSRRTGKRLDEGLSNFALDEAAQLYYVDDDIYDRDDWVALSHIIGVYIRRLPWLQGEYPYRFGQICQQAMLAHLEDKHYLTVLAELLDDIFVPAAREVDLREMRRGLIGLKDNPHGHTTASYTPLKAPSSIKTPTSQGHHKAQKMDVLGMVERASAELEAPHKPEEKVTANTFDSQTDTDTHTEQTDIIPPDSERYWVLLADIHANLPALDAVLEFVQARQLENILVLGDVVGYGPHPQACIQRLQALNCPVIKGNHDHALGGADYSKGYSQTARWALDWSQDKVTKEEKQWLEDLPPVLREPHYLALHGAPIDPTFFRGYVYAMTYEDNLDVLEKKQMPLCFHGHTHIPGVYARYNTGEDKHHSSPGNDVSFDLSQAKHCLICPGSIGQPRNGQSGAEFAIYDWHTHSIQYHCIEYDQESLVQDMIKQQFPDSLVQVFR